MLLFLSAIRKFGQHFVCYSIGSQCELLLLLIFLFADIAWMKQVELFEEFEEEERRNS